MLITFFSPSKDLEGHSAVGFSVPWQSSKANGWSRGKGHTPVERRTTVLPELPWRDLASKKEEEERE